jgi:hypothetical protein
MLLLFFALFKPFGHVVFWFGRLTHELSATSGIGGGLGPGFDLISTRLGRPVETGGKRR